MDGWIWPIPESGQNLQQTCFQTDPEREDIEGFRVPSVAATESYLSETKHQAVNSCQPTTGNSRHPANIFTIKSYMKYQYITR